MKADPMLAIADAVDESRRTTAAYTHLVDLIDHAYRTEGPDTQGQGSARADLLGLFAEKMRGNDERIARLVREAAPHIKWNC